MIAGLVLAAPAAAEYRLELIETGQREDSCAALMRPTNLSDAPLTEISGHIHLVMDGERVGRSEGAWFGDLAPGESAEAVFETPNAPCGADLRHEMVVGACRLGAGFEDVGVCAARPAPVAPMALAPPS